MPEARSSESLGCEGALDPRLPSNSIELSINIGILYDDMTMKEHPATHT
jgi:hypothetical protein